MKNFFFSFLQFSLFIFLLLSGPLYIFSIPFVLIQMVSLLLIFWAFLVKMTNKHPASRRAPRGIYLITSGPYEIIRHPIYTGLLLFVLSYSLGYYTIFQYLAFLFFLILILIRINYDEKLTEFHFKKNYRDYKNKTKQLIPYIY